MEKWFKKWDRWFRISLDNWYSISVQFWYGSYCDNYTRIDLLEQTKENSVLRCDNAEVAIIYNDDLVTQELRPDIFAEDIWDSVAPHVTPYHVARIISHIESLPPQTN